MAGLLGSIGAMLAWVVIIMMQVQMAEMKRRISKLEDDSKQANS